MSDELHEAGCGCQEYNELSRRDFLSAAATMTAASMFPAWLPKIVMSKNYASNRDIIVSIFQRGAADGLAIVVPYADPTYYTARPTIGIPRPGDANGGFDLDGFFAFAPAMTNLTGTGGLMPAFKANDLLMTHATGIQTNNSRSHFDAQRFMEVGKPADPTVITGWLGRHLSSIPPLVPGALLRGVGISNGLQKQLVAPTNATYPTHTLPIADPTNFTIGGSSTTAAARTSMLQADYTAGDEPLKSAALDAINTVSLLKAVNFSGYTPANGAVYPNSSFGRALRSVAVLIKNNVGIEAASIDIGGWDTHASQGAINGGMKNLMLDFSNSLGAFYADVIALGGFNVTVIAMSEFGRNVRENASAGTDHGRGTVFFAMGKGISGGRVLTQNWVKSLDRANLEAGQDLPVGIDYRDVLAEIVQNRLANPNLDFIFPADGTYKPKFLGVTR